MELTNAQWLGFIISILVITGLIYWISIKIKTQRSAVTFRTKDQKKEDKFVQGVINDIDKVLCKLKISAQKESTFSTREGQIIRYADIDIVIHTDNWYSARIEYQNTDILIQSHEIKNQERVQNFFVSLIHQNEVMPSFA